MANYVNEITLNEAIVKAAIKQKEYVDTNFQKKSDESLLTEDKTIVGAINELSQKSTEGIVEINLIDGGNANGTN